MITAAILTISDSTAHGVRQDLSGPALAQSLTTHGFRVVAHEVVPDESARIRAALLALCDAARMVVTTGGTGISPRDVTPEATSAVCDRLIPGMSEVMRAQGLKRTPLAALSRALCGSKGESLIVNVPGNPMGAVESLLAVLPMVPHALDLLAGRTTHANSSDPA